MIPFIITRDKTISLVLDNIPVTVNPDHINYNKIVAQLKGEQSVEELKLLVNTSNYIKEYMVASTEIEIVIDDDQCQIFRGGQPIHGLIIDKIFEMIKEGYDSTPLVNFLRNLYENPSQRAIDELYGFLEYGKLPITEDGHFLAYKKVNNDYTSVHDNKTDNSIGTIVRMPRDQVNDNSYETCSTGLHLCSHEYLHYMNGHKVVILKVNPKNIVSIPIDYRNTKARACEYEVIGELTQYQLNAQKPVFDKPIQNSVPEDNPITMSDLLELEDEVYERYAYTEGYYDGRHKKQIRSAFENIITSHNNNQQHVCIVSDNTTQKMNIAYNLGYSDGKKHAKRQYPITKITELLNDD